MLDAIAIKQHIQYNSHTQKMSGFVDMVDGMTEMDVSTEALVFWLLAYMATGRLQLPTT